MKFTELTTRTRNALATLCITDRASAWKWIEDFKHPRGRHLGVHAFLYTKDIGRKSMDEIVEWLSTEDEETSESLSIIAVSMREISATLKRIEKLI